MIGRFETMAAALVAGALAVAALTGPAVAADDGGYFGWAASGTTFEVGPQHYFFVGSFSGVLRTDAADSPLQNAAVQCPGSLSIGIEGAGFCVYTDAGGDKLFSTWTCPTPAATPAGAIAALNCTNVFTGGTGKYNGVSGGNNFLGVTLMAHPDGTVSGYSAVSDMKLTLKSK